jgi:protein TonB
MNQSPIWHGIAFMIVGGSLMLSAAVLINRAVETDMEPKQESKIVNFGVTKAEKSNPKRKSEIRSTEKSKKAAQQKINASPSLAGAVSGLDFGLGGGAAGSEKALSETISSDTDDAVMSSENLDSTPRPLRTTPVEYPSQARDQKLNGYVSVSILISEQGKVEKVMVQESEPKGVFDQAVIDSIKGWQFEPAKYKGKSVRVWASQRIVFGESS